MGLAIVLPASAQLADSNSDVEVLADNARYVRSACRGEWSRNVRMVQGGTRLTTDRLTLVQYQPSAANQECGDIREFIAEGNVYYITPNERIRSDRAQYDYDTDTITMTGDVVLSRGEQGVMRGTKLVYSVQNGLATVTSEKGPVVSIFPSKNRSE
jgi:lipopolysaccharide export system protein LptA